jgi:hypothetical protein
MTRPASLAVVQGRIVLSFLGVFDADGVAD